MFWITLAIDLMALAIAVLAGFLAMPLGGLLGAVVTGAVVFSMVWKVLGNSKKDLLSMRKSAKVAEKGDSRGPPDHTGPPDRK